MVERILADVVVAVQEAATQTVAAEHHPAAPEVLECVRDDVVAAGVKVDPNASRATMTEGALLHPTVMGMAQAQHARGRVEHLPVMLYPSARPPMEEEPPRVGEVDPADLERTLARHDTQPLSERTFGSTFTNPKGGFAGKLIEDAGLKGYKRGGAMVSKKHANFIVNTGDDTRANDVEDLIRDVIERVKAKFNVVLKPEVIIVGNR